MVALWSVVGVLVLTSSSWWVAEREMGDAAYYLKRQLIWMVASWGLLWLGLRTSLRRWLHIAPMALLICLLMVVILMVDR
jgi:cell division protein FtsW